MRADRGLDETENKPRWDGWRQVMRERAGGINEDAMVQDVSQMLTTWLGVPYGSSFLDYLMLSFGNQL